MLDYVGCGEVVIGAGSVIESGVQLGHRTGGKLRIGKNAFIRSGSVIYSDATIGDNFRSGHNILIREDTSIGDDVLVGTNSVVDGNCVIGNDVCMQTSVYIAAHTTIEDKVFMGPCCVTTNDRYMQQGSTLKGSLIKKEARIGANAVILPELVIGPNAVIGAGSVVTKNVEGDQAVFGNPARVSTGKSAVNL